MISQTLTSEEIKTKVLNFLSKVWNERYIDLKKKSVIVLFKFSLYRLMYPFLQTVSHQESEEARLERLKEWRSIIEKHCEQMERETSSPVHTPLPEEVSERTAYFIV